MSRRRRSDGHRIGGLADLAGPRPHEPFIGKRETRTKTKPLVLPLDPERWKYKGRPVVPGSRAANRAIRV